MQRYEMHPGLLKIFDEKLGIDIEEPFDPQLLILKKEEKNGFLIKMSCLLEGKLHGPSIFYDGKGTLLSISWFCHGLREGFIRQYYPSGRLYAFLGYVKGLKEGEHKYYDHQGSLRSSIHYRKGVLDGKMTLFWPSGQLKRELFLIQGKKWGEERFWDESGALKKEIVHAS
jgi:antitoxin component YwqK of YwqJK toxin-antitoxin module